MNKQTQQHLLKLVKKNYEEIAEEYDQTRRKYASPLKKEIEKHAEKIKKDAKILDVGCGNARLLDSLPRQNIDYLGIDAGEEMIKTAKQRFPEHKFQVLDVLELNQLPKEKFDYIFCIAVLHHLPGQDLQIKALKQMGDKLSADGELIISVWNLWSQKKMRKRIARFFFLKILGKSKMDIGDIIFDWKGNKKKKNSQRYYHAFTKRELKKIIKKAGLTPKNIYQDKYNYFATATRHQ